MNNNLILIDGGMGQELIHRSKKKPDGLWSARVMLDEYDLVVDLHKDFINAGAEAITLNSYSVTPQRLKRFNLENMFKELQKTAINAALDAINLASNEKNIKILIRELLPYKSLLLTYFVVKQFVLLKRLKLARKKH